MPKTRSALAIVLVLGALLPAARAEERGITCSLEGAATIEPGLNMTDQEYKVVFKGDLTDCQATGGESAGSVVSKVTATGTCGYATAEGVAKVKWDNGKKTTVAISTEDVGALVALTFEVTKSSSTSLMEGDQGFGLLAFQADAAACNSDEGITEATFNGQVGGGSPS